REREREEQQRQVHERQTQDRGPIEEVPAVEEPARPAVVPQVPSQRSAPASAPRERPPATSAPARGSAADDRHTRYGRQELHVATDVSSRYKKKRRVK